MTRFHIHHFALALGAVLCLGSAGCAGEAEARDAGIRDRSSADQSVQRAGRGAKAEGPIKGKPGPVAEKRKALAAYNRALA